MKTRIFILLISALVSRYEVSGNGISINNLNTVFTPTTGIVTAKFDLSWENSWRSNATQNWDAAWVFFKFRVGYEWRHLDLTGNDITLPSGYAYEVSGDKKGIFIYRSGPGTGTVTLTDCLVGLQPQMGSFDIRAFAIEMVYVPAAAFYVGDAISPSSYRTSNLNINDPPTPYVMGNTAASIAMGNSQNGLLYDPLGNGTLNANFPTGYASYYLMKHELSNAGVRDYLNSLTYQQQLSIESYSQVFNLLTSSTGTKLSSFSSSEIEIMTPGNAGSSVPAVFGCDGNNNNTYNEADDGEWVSFHNGSYDLLIDYLDWAALRPYTELEYEKAARGTLLPIGGEFAWGTNNIDTLPYAFSNRLSANAGVSNVQNLGSAIYLKTDTSSTVFSHTRNGIFATATSNRISSGGGFYGFMELTGNVAEVVVTTYSTNGRNFNGSHGDGNLNPTFTNGHLTNNSNYVSLLGTSSLVNNTMGFIKRGDIYGTNNFPERVSERHAFPDPQFAGATRWALYNGLGIRGARSSGN